MTSFIMKSNVALDVESKALVEPSANKKTTIVDIESSKAESKRNRGSSLKQVMTSLIANLGTINTGLVFGFSAVALPQLKNPDSSSLVLGLSEASWFASMSSISTPIGCLLSGWLMDRIGRKKTLIVTELPLIIGWLLICSAVNIEMLYIGRLFVGFGSGMVGAPARVYTSEVTQPHLRGMLSALASVGVSLGVLIEYTFGSFLSWSLLAGINTIIPILSCVLISLMPETPNWLLSKGRTEDARIALNRCRGGACNVDKELNKLVGFVTDNNIVQLSGWKDTWKALVKPSSLKPFGILFTYFLIYQFSGVNSITFYAVDVFEESGTALDKNFATILLGIIRLVSTIIACVLLRRCGRRPLTMISGIGCGITMLGLGSYMYAAENWKATGQEVILTWIPLALIFLFIIASTLGYLVVPWVMIGEVYPTQVRGIAGGCTTFIGHFFVFLVVKTFPLFQELMSNHGTFWLYGAISLTGSIFFYLCLPETKGRSLQEIEDYFCGRVKTLGKIPSSANMPRVLDVPKGQVLP
ncbi:facilitated trehalose transporter Tret1-2 homolog [Anabrus simplex]|uniref:facilitated trehalose transporter Tret1-2 homolog n=1 Tax=Anabrus simplex TaxID=316456 RepID=UPI0035A351DB